jgi:hypothetical protein
MFFGFSGVVLCLPPTGFGLAVGRAFKERQARTEADIYFLLKLSTKDE